MTDDSYRISLEGTPSVEDVRVIDEGLRAYGQKFAPQVEEQPLSVMLRTSDGRLAGGLLGETGWGWLYVGTLWLEEGARRRGYGSELLRLAESEAVHRGCHSSHLSTLSYEALPFYRRHGYEIFGELPDFPPGHRRYFLKKRLVGQG
jgi:GNAT superfamily N-acetyltransferase